MVRGWVAWALFVSSYTPLYLLLGVQSAGRNGAEPVMVASGVLLIVGALGTVLFLRAAAKKTPGEYKVLKAKRRDADVAAYAVGYLLPFVSVVDDGWRDQVSLLLFFLLLGFIYVRSRMIYVNPVLFAMGYQLSEVTVTTAGAGGATPSVRLLLSDGSDVDADESLSAIRVTEDLLLINQKGGK